MLLSPSIFIDHHAIYGKRYQFVLWHPLFHGSFIIIVVVIDPNQHMQATGSNLVE